MTAVRWKSFGVEVVSILRWSGAERLGRVVCKRTLRLKMNAEATMGEMDAVDKAFAEVMAEEEGLRSALKLR